MDPDPIPPPIGSGYTPELYKLPGLKFQALCRDLLDSGGDPEISSCAEYGINGQPQHGIDLIADRKQGGRDVAQCKALRNFPPSKIREASAEFLKHIAVWKSRDVRRFIVLVGSEVSERQVRDEIIKQQREFEQQHGISYELWPASRIVDKLRPYPGIVSQYLHSAWVETICGPNTGPSIRIELAKNVAFADRLMSELSNVGDERLSRMKEQWRKGRRQEALEILSSTKSNQVVWNALSPRVQAGFLRFEASSALDSAGDVSKAEILLSQSRALSPDRDDARVEAAIQWYTGDLTGALRTLDRAHTDVTKHFKVFLLLLLRRTEEAELLLGEVSEETAETLHLRGMCNLAKGHLSEARLSLQKALEKSPEWVNLQYTAAVIDYFSALALAVVPPFIPPWPEPVPSIYVLGGQEAREHIARAATRFGRLVANAEFGDEERLCVETWRIACLAIDLSRQGEFEQEATRILRSNPTHHRVLAWAIVTRLRSSFAVPVDAIRQLVINGEAKPEQVLVLSQYYVTNNKPQKAATLLRDQQKLFIADNLTPLWVSWRAQVEARLGHTQEALSILNGAAFAEKEFRLLKARIHLLDNSTSPSTLIQYLEESYRATSDPRFLLDLVERYAREKRWADAASHARALLSQIRTPEVLRLVSFCAHEGGRFSLCLDLLNSGQDLYPQLHLPTDLRRLKVHCQIEVGLLPAAAEEAERVAKEDPTLQNLLALAHVYFSIGDARRLSSTARDVLFLDTVPPDVLLTLAAQTRWDDQAVSTDLWRRATVLPVPDSLVVPALRLGFDLGLDKELFELTHRMEELGRGGHAGVRMVSLDDLKEHAKAFHEQAQKLNEAYQGAQLPVHLIVTRLNLTLAEVYHALLNDNARAHFLWRRPRIFARSGRRALLSLQDVTPVDFRLNADISAVLFAQHYGFLESTEEALGPVRIPQELIPALAAMRDQLTSIQAQRVTSYRQILAAQRAGRVEIAPERRSSRTDIPRTLGNTWNGLVEIAVDTSGFLVDFIPMVTIEGNVDHKRLPPDIEHRVIGIRAILIGLKQDGVLPSDRYSALIGRYPRIRDEPRTQVPHAGSRLYVRGSLIELITDLDLLPMVADHFQVFVENQEIERILGEIQAAEQKEQLASWIGGLIDHINRAIDRGRCRTISSEELGHEDQGDAGEEHSDGLLAGCLRDLMSLHPDSADRAWCDDRFINTHHSVGETPIVDSIDVLQQLVARGAMPKERYYETISRIRAEGVCFLPVCREEILTHLLAAPKGQHGVEETTGLRDLRRGLAGLFLSGKFLCPATQVEHSFDPGEYAVLTLSMSAISKAMSELWNSQEVPEAERVQCADWIAYNIYVPHHAVRRIARPELPLNDVHAFSLAAASLLTETFSFLYDDAGNEAARKFNAWVNQTLLERRFMLEPAALVQTAVHLQRLIEQIWPGDLNPGDSRVAVALIQRYFLRLPEDIRTNMADPEAGFLEKIGVRTEAHVEAAGLRFERNNYLTAAREAINGRESSVALKDREGNVKFLPTEPPGSGLQFIHPDHGTRILVDDWLNRILIDSPKLRHEVAKALEPMFDLPSAVRQETLADLASTNDFIKRIDKGESLRAKSLPYFYSQLEATIRAGSHLDLRTLLPTDPSTLLRFLRISEPVDSGFTGALVSGIEEMITSLPLAESLDRLMCLPIELPDKVVWKVRNLPSSEKRKLIDVLLGRANSPLWRLQFLRLADQCFSNEEPYVNIWNVLPSDGGLELRSYLILVRWTFDELLIRVTHKLWSVEAILATSWVHADHLFCIFQECGLVMSELMENFSTTPSRTNSIFRDWGLLDRDVANPHNVTPNALLVGGLRCVSNERESYCLYPELRDRFRSLVSTKATFDGPAFPALDLIQDVTGAPNQLSSFLSYDRLSTFRSFGGDAAEPIATLRGKLESETLMILKDDHKNGWAMLKAAFGNEPIPEAYLDEIRAAVGRMDVDGNQDPTEICTRLFLASTFLKFVASSDVIQHVKEQLIKIAGKLSRQSKPEDVNINTWHLLEIALNLARCETTANARVTAFATVVADLAFAWPSLAKRALPLVQEMCDGLPLEQTGEIWRLNLRLRSH